jgi:hypothetical protein
MQMGVGGGLNPGLEPQTLRTRGHPGLQGALQPCPYVSTR